MTQTQKILLVTALIAFGVLGRLVPHPWNVTPIAAAALFAGAILGGRAGIVVPLVSMTVSDMFLGAYEWQLMLAVYGCMVGTGLLGRVIGSHYKLTTAVPTAILGSFGFFLITNWTVWQFSPWYDHNTWGLMQCYIAALPFWRLSFFGDIFFTVTLFGLYELRRVPFLKRWSKQNAS